uniref:Putative radical SAM superfamily protein n=1 Tax=viral metagenome TaxID=1070528 RepID=A0A6H1ZVC3_9ZZZZ
MRILLIVLPFTVDVCEFSHNDDYRTWKAIPYGVLQLIKYCQDLAEFRVVDCNVDEKYQESIVQTMKEWEPHRVGFSMTFDGSYPYLAELAKIVKDIDPRVWIVVGGAATLATYREIITEQKSIDAVCYSDGEVPFRDILLPVPGRWADLYGHVSWITRESLNEGRVPQKSPIPNLDDVTDVDYTYVDVSKYSMVDEFNLVPMRDVHRFYIMTSRGCPFRCKFCFRSRENDPRMQFASISKVIDHVKRLVDDFGMDALVLCDDQLLVDMKRAKELFRQLAQFHLRVEVQQGVGLGFIDEEMVDLMVGAGMVKLLLNVESGSQEMLDLMVTKPVNLDKAREIIKIIRSHGVWTSAIFVCGFPGETDTHRAETLKWIESTELDWCRFRAAIPIRGTVLYDICIKNGYIQPDIKFGDLDYGNYTIHVPGYPPEYVTDQIYKMNLQTNFVNNPQMRRGDYAIAARMFKQIIDNVYEGHAFAHYYLSKCLGKMMGINAEWHYSRFQEIINTDKTWARYATEYIKEKT